MNGACVFPVMDWWLSWRQAATDPSDTSGYRAGRSGWMDPSFSLYYTFVHPITRVVRCSSPSLFQLMFKYDFP